MTRLRARAASPTVHALAEGPWWDAAGERLVWVDIEAGTVHEGRLAGDRVTATRSSHVDRQVGAAVPSTDGRILVAGRSRLWVLEPDGSRTAGPEVLPADAERRLNDGSCDPAGRFLVGSLSLGDRTDTEILCRLEDDGTLTTLDDDLALSNGLGWSPDGGTLYSVDTLPGAVHARDYDVVTGRTGTRRDHLHVTDGYPDGLCVDAEGNLWIAIFGAGEVRCFSPSGALLHTVEVDAPHTTSAAFVGPDLDTLVITSGRVEMSEAEHAAHPESGSLFLADVGVRGLVRTPWNGRGIPVASAEQRIGV